MRTIAVLVCAVAGVAWAQSGDGAVFWPAAKLKGYAPVLKAKMPTVVAGKKQMLAIEDLANRGNHTYLVARRDESGEAEVHANWADIHIGQEGEAAMIYGGKLEGGRETGPGEIRGGKIVGGTTQKLGPGDVIVIPAGVPHHTTLAPGKSWTVFIVKIEKK